MHACLCLAHFVYNYLEIAYQGIEPPKVAFHLN